MKRCRILSRVRLKLIWTRLKETKMGTQSRNLATKLVSAQVSKMVRQIIPAIKILRTARLLSGPFYRKLSSKSSIVLVVPILRGRIKGAHFQSSRRPKLRGRTISWLKSRCLRMSAKVASSESTRMNSTHISSATSSRKRDATITSCTTTSSTISTRICPSILWIKIIKWLMGVLVVDPMSIDWKCPRAGQSP